VERICETGEFEAWSQSEGVMHCKAGTNKELDVICSQDGIVWHWWNTRGSWSQSRLWKSKRAISDGEKVKQRWVTS